MVLFILILISIILSIGFFLLATYIATNHHKNFKSFFKWFIKRDENYIAFNIMMIMVLFMVFFVTSAAIYNTYIDNTNPNYYKNKNKIEHAK